MVSYFKDESTTTTGGERHHMYYYKYWIPMNRKWALFESKSHEV